MILQPTILVINNSGYSVFSRFVSLILILYCNNNDQNTELPEVADQLICSKFSLKREKRIYLVLLLIQNTHTIMQDHQRINVIVCFASSIIILCDHTRSYMRLHYTWHSHDSNAPKETNIPLSKKQRQTRYNSNYWPGPLGTSSQVRL